MQTVVGFPAHTKPGRGSKEAANDQAQGIAGPTPLGGSHLASLDFNPLQHAPPPTAGPLCCPSTAVRPYLEETSGDMAGLGERLEYDHKQIEILTIRAISLPYVFPLSSVSFLGAVPVWAALEQNRKRKPLRKVALKIAKQKAQGAQAARVEGGRLKVKARELPHVALVDEPVTTHDPIKTRNRPKSGWSVVCLRKP